MDEKSRVAVPPGAVGALITSLPLAVSASIAKVSLPAPSVKSIVLARPGGEDVGTRIGDHGVGRRKPPTTLSTVFPAERVSDRPGAAVCCAVLDRSTAIPVLWVGEKSRVVLPAPVAALMTSLPWSPSASRPSVPPPDPGVKVLSSGPAVNTLSSESPLTVLVAWPPITPVIPPVGVSSKLKFAVMVWAFCCERSTVIGDPWVGAKSSVSTAPEEPMIATVPSERSASSM